MKAELNLEAGGGSFVMLGSGPGSTAERARIKLNIEHGTVSLYIWCTVNLLASMASEYVQWPSEEVRRPEKKVASNTHEPHSSLLDSFIAQLASSSVAASPQR